MSVRSTSRFTCERAAVSLAARFTQFLFRNFRNINPTFDTVVSSRGICLNWTFVPELSILSYKTYVLSEINEWLLSQSDLCQHFSLEHSESKVIVKLIVL